MLAFRGFVKVDQIFLLIKHEISLIKHQILLITHVHLSDMQLITLLTVVINFARLQAKVFFKNAVFLKMYIFLAFTQVEMQLSDFCWNFFYPLRYMLFFIRVITINHHRFET